MLFIVGLRTEPKPAATGTSRRLSCVRCGHGELKGSVYRQYVHVMFVPCMPAGTNAVVTCPNCGMEWQDLFMPQQYKEEISGLRKRVQAPWYYWIGLVVLVIGVTAAIVISRNT